MANPDAPPLFIVGAPRSGTSLVYRLLALHPQASWVNNYLRRAPAMPVLSALNRVARATPKLRASVWFGSDGDNAYRYGGARSVLERLYPQPTEGEPLFAHHGVPEAWGGEQVTERQRGLVPALSRVARWSGGPTLVSKRIGHNRRIDLLHELDPAARFLSVTRDGRAVAHSLLKVDWWPQMQIWWFDDRLPADWAAEGRDPLELCARHWVREVETIEAGLAAVPDEQVMRIHYEQLIADPMAVLSQVATFSGLDPHDRSWREALSAVHFPNKNTTWSASLSESEQQTLTLLDGQLHEMGYL